MQRFSEQVVMNKSFLLNPEKKLAQIRNVVFEKKRLTPTHSQIRINDVTVPQATLITRKGQFQQSFASLMTLFLNNFVYK